MNKTVRVAPVSPSERIISLDVLRGFAVLGILIINIQSFSMIQAAYFNPTAYGDLSGLNKWVWILSYLFFEQKFMTIFSILFGAGIMLMSRKVEAKDRSAAGIHYRRTLWLLIIGLMHAYLLWYGDILVIYGLCALLAYLFRKISPKKLLIIALILLAVSSLLYLFFGFSLPYWPKEAYQNTLAFWKPNQSVVDHELSAYRGSWMNQMSIRVIASLSMQTFVFMIWGGWRAGGLMLLGMALYKWGVLSAERSKRFYLILMLVGFIFGLPVVIYGVISNFAHKWSFDYSMYFGWQYNYWGSILVSLAYISIVMLICKSIRLKKFTNPFAAAGRMALTNYLLQTVICTTLFYGHGFGLFGYVERKYQILIVFVLWILQLIISTIWLRYFRFGPAEWVWRSLTYLKIGSVKLSVSEKAPKWLKNMV